MSQALENTFPKGLFLLPPSVCLSLLPFLSSSSLDDSSILYRWGGVEANSSVYKLRVTPGPH